MLQKIISGGQTGADRAALDAAMAAGFETGGWCPAGRLAEDGRIPDNYDMKETASPDYDERTRLNVQDSDGTLVMTDGDPKGGTQLTIEVARLFARPLLIVNSSDPDLDEACAWVNSHSVHVLNVAGPRTGESSSIYQRTYRFISLLLTST